MKAVAFFAAVLLLMGAEQNLVVPPPSTGACTMTVGTSCVATTAGSIAGQKCFIGLQGSTPLAFLCACSAGNGSTTITCPAATTGTMAVLTSN